MTHVDAGGPIACVMGTMDLVRPLGMAGVGCAVVTRPGGAPLYSRHTRTALYWRDSWGGDDELLEALLRFGRAQPEPPVLFYEEDRQLALVSRGRDRLARSFRFVVADRTLVEDLVDKARFQSLADRHGLPVPPARRLRPGAERCAPDVDLRFPVIVKPITHGAADAGWWREVGSAKALQIDTPAALRDAWPRLAAAGAELLVQEVVAGPEARIESYHVYVDARGDVAAEFTGRKLRTFPTTYGRSTALTITDAGDVAALGRDVVRAIGLRGVAKLDFKRAPDGTLHLLEINPRFNLWHHLGAAAGVNLPAFVYADLVGRPRPAARRARAGTCWCAPQKDRLAATAGGMSVATWLLWALRCEAKSGIAWDDPLPYLRNKLGRLVPASAWRGAAPYPTPLTPGAAAS